MARNSESRKRQETKDEPSLVNLQVDAHLAATLLAALNFVGEQHPAVFSADPSFQQFRNNVAMAHAILQGEK